MNKYLRFSFFFFILTFLSISLSAQYGPQFDNRGFEQWTTREATSVSEPVHWHSGGTATGTYSSFLSSQVEASTHKRPGSSGIKSVRLFPSSVLGVTANGNVTNGRINAGSMQATGSGNYSYTQRSQNAYNTPITQLPDSLTVWVCFRSQSTTHNAQVKAVVHGDADFQIVANGSVSPSNMHVATAVQGFTRTAPANGDYNWRRLSIPFNNSGPCTDIRYILLMATTNETAGTGSTNDDLFLDDLLLIYNPTLNLSQLASNSFAPGDALTVNFTLSGTMSPDNLVASANQVIAQLSDANGSFNSPTELGRVTTNTSGSITAQIPNVAAGNGYRIRVISTNYPLTGGNIQTVSIAPATSTITVAANPSDGGTVTGGGTYNNGESCTVTATANTGYTFANWTENGNAVSTNANYTFTVTGGRTLVANFAQQTYTITATADPANGGTVTGGGTYSYGQTCTLAATAASGYTFINWTKNGQQVSTNTNYSFTVTESAAYVAHFQAQTPSYTIRVSSNPSNGGTVSGGGTYEQGATCTVTATPNQRYVFVNWTENGNVVSTSASYSFVVTANRVLVANFEGEAIDIKVNIEPAESAQVTGEGTYHYGDEVTLTVTPNENYVFQNWTEGGLVVCETPTYTFTATVSRTLTANLLYTEGVGESNCKVTLYPNPVNDKLTVEANETIDKVEIYNLVGALVYSERSCSDKVEITTADLQSGIYFIRLTTKNASETRRFVKE
jgi:hypothetical protein